MMIFISGHSSFSPQTNTLLPQIVSYDKPLASEETYLAKSVDKIRSTHSEVHIVGGNNVPGESSLVALHCVGSL